MVFGKYNSVYEWALVNPSKVANIEKAGRFLLNENVSEEDKEKVLTYIVELKNSELTRREHKSGYKQQLNSLYKDFPYKEFVNQKEFVDLYRSMEEFDLEEYYPDQRIKEALLIFESIDYLDNNGKLKLLASIYDFVYGEDHYKNLLSIAMEFVSDYGSAEELQLKVAKIIGVLKKDFKNATYHLANAFTVDQFSNDTQIENTIILAKAQWLKAAMKDEYHKWIIVDPTLLFVHYFLNNTFFEDDEVLFVFLNENLAYIADKILCNQLDKKSVYIDDIENYYEYNGSAKRESLVIFSNHHKVYEDKTDLLKRILKTSENIDYISILDSDNSIQSSDGAIHNVTLKNHYYPFKLFLLPSGINNGTNPQRKMLAVYANRNMENRKISVTRFSLAGAERNRQIIKQHVHDFNISQSDYINDVNIRTNIWEQISKKSKSSNRKENSSFEETFSLYIKINFTFSDSKRTSYYIRDLFTLSEDSTTIKTGNIISETKVEGRCKSIDQAKEKAINDYPYLKKKTNNRTIDIRNEVIKTYVPKLLNSCLDLKTMLYLYPEFEQSDSFPVGLLPLLRKACDSNLKYIRIDDVDYDTATKMIEERFGDNELDSIDQIMNQLSKLIDFAIKKKHASKNNIKDNLKKTDDRSILANVFANLTQRSLTKEQYMNAYSAATKKLKTDKRYLAVLIKLFCPIDFDEISGLLIGDFKEPESFNDDDHFYYFDIYKRVKKNNRNIYYYAPLYNEFHYRNVPLFDDLGMIISDYIDTLKKEYSNMSIKDFQSMPLIPGSINIDGNKAVCDPLELSQLVRNLLKKIKVDKEIIRVYDEEQGYLEKDVAIHRGDFCKTNLEYYLIKEDVCHFNISELDHYLGRQSSRTYGKHYVDYDDDGYMLIYYLKLNNFKKIIYERNYKTTFKSFNNYGSFSDKATTNTLHETIIRLNAKDKAKIKLFNNHGFDVQIIREED